MRNLLAALMLFPFLNTWAWNCTPNKDIKVLSASRQTTFGGIAGAPVTTLYIIKVKALRTFTLKADSVFADGRIAAFSIVKDSFNLASTLKIKKGQVITLSFYIFTSSIQGGGNYQSDSPGSRPADPPFAIGNGALLLYKGGKSKQLLIKDIEAKPDIFLP